MRTSAIGRISSGEVGDLVHELSMRVGNVERLDELQTGPARRRLVYFVGFQTSAVRDNDERAWCHKQNDRLGARKRAHHFYNEFARRGKVARKKNSHTEATKVTTVHNEEKVKEGFFGFVSFVPVV